MVFRQSLREEIGGVMRGEQGEATMGTVGGGGGDFSGGMGESRRRKMNRDVCWSVG
jgi:hypothetical protein